MTSPIQLNELAHKIFWKAKAQADRQQAEWEAEAAEFAAQGFRPERCIHGTYMWVEWDCACGYCEMGEPLWDDARDWDDAKRQAALIYKSVDDRFDAAMKAIMLDTNNSELRQYLVDWVLEPLTPWK